MADPTKPSGGTDNSFSGAIMALMRALGTAGGSKPLVAPGHILDAQIAQALGNGTPQQPVAPPPAAVPQAPMPRTSLGNQSPGLGQSF
jgi:hypothetical protein